MSVRHFLDLQDIPPEILRRIITNANIFKKRFRQGEPASPTGRFLHGRYVALVFEWPATRTKLHFEVATYDLGGTVLNFYGRDMPTMRGETMGDTARVLSRHVDLIMLRTGDHRRLLEMAAQSTCPVIN